VIFPFQIDEQLVGSIFGQHLFSGENLLNFCAGAFSSVGFADLRFPPLSMNADLEVGR
jgi:hypothetical protein